MSARLSMLLSPARKSVLTDGDSDPVAKLRQAASTFRETPSIFVRPTPPSPAEKVTASHRMIYVQLLLMVYRPS